MDSTECKREWCRGVGRGRSEGGNGPSLPLLQEQKLYSDVLKDWGPDAEYFERPRFPHHPLHASRPHPLSPPHTKPTVQIPAPLAKHMRAYQRQGVQYLYSQYVCGRGAVLADDTGLGKKVQVVGFMCAVLGKSNTKADLIQEQSKQVSSNGCFLVVCPAPTLCNWTSQLETWSHLKYVVCTIDNESEILDRVTRQQVEVFLTPPDVLCTNMDALNSVQWLAVFCDKVQEVMVVNDTLFPSLNKLHVKKRFALTSAAPSSNLSHLWNLLNWVRPGCLQSLSTFLTSQQTRFTHVEGEEMLKKTVLRRTRALVTSQLPTREEVVVLCPLTVMQESMYRALLDCDDVQLILHSEELCDCCFGQNRGNCCYKHNAEGVHWSTLFPEYACLFNKCANHLGLLLPSPAGKEGCTRVCEEAFSRYPQFLEMSRRAAFITLSDPQYCGKMKVLEQMLTKFHDDRDRVLIFSHSIKLLNMVQDHLVSAGYTHTRVDSSTGREERSQLVKSFNTNITPFIFLLSEFMWRYGSKTDGS